MSVGTMTVQRASVNQKNDALLKGGDEVGWILSNRQHEAGNCEDASASTNR